MKFPSQRKLLYYDDSISNDALGLISSGGTGSGAICLPKDLSILNRRGYASTNRKGVPLVYRVKVDLYSQALDATGPSAAVGSDFQTTLKIDGAQDNWVMKNAAVKLHAARENQFKKQGSRNHIGEHTVMKLGMAGMRITKHGLPLLTEMVMPSPEVHGI